TTGTGNFDGHVRCKSGLNIGDPAVSPFYMFNIINRCYYISNNNICCLRCNTTSREYFISWFNQC
ncbi:MAG: hypothetical protein ACKPKO_01895, partial [Candidatus Fonsibacter sp.]